MIEGPGKKKDQPGTASQKECEARKKGNDWVLK